LREGSGEFSHICSGYSPIPASKSLFVARATHAVDRIGAAMVLVRKAPSGCPMLKSLGLPIRQAFACAKRDRWCMSADTVKTRHELWDLQQRACGGCVHLMSLIWARTPTLTDDENGAGTGQLPKLSSRIYADNEAEVLLW
jgi:hypothetical protein